MTTPQQTSGTTAHRQRLDECEEALRTAMQAIESLRARNVDLDSRLSLLETNAPAEVRALKRDTVVRVLAENPCIRLEVLADWRGQFVKGSVVRADHVTRLLDYVDHGLLLGLPVEQDKAVALAKADAQRRIEQTEQELAHIRTIHARVEIEAAQNRLAAMQPAPPIEISLGA